VFRCIASSEVGIEEECPGAVENSVFPAITADYERIRDGWMRVVSVGQIRAVESFRGK
jgi:hypothetical protein